MTDSGDWRGTGGGRRRKPGTVYLVGAGPGDPDLLTVAAARLLRRADVVIHDALVGPGILDLVGADARLVDVGKRCGGRRTSQERINEILVEEASGARTIVRLKGGDPFVFGRGGEEALALRAAGVPFRVIPGVTAGVGVSAYAGIPVTHRGLSASVTFVTGHEDVGGAQSRIDWESLARINGTLVVYMGVGTLATVAERLTAAGKSSDTPAAVIEWGTIARQRTVASTLGEIAATAHAAGIGSPALVVIGEVVSLRERLAWYDRLPLRGRRITVARSRPQRSRIASALAGLGAEVSEYPRLVDVPVALEPRGELIMSDLPRYQWVVFTSVPAVKHFWRELGSRSLDARSLGGARIAAFGVETSRALGTRGILPDVNAPTFKVDTVARLLATRAPLQGSRVLIPGDMDLTSPIADFLRESGASVDELPIFRTEAEEGDSGALRQQDVIVLPSSTAARTMAEALARGATEGRISSARVIAIGPRTAQTALDCGLIVDSVAAEHTVAGMVAAIRKLGDDASSEEGRSAPEAAWSSLLADAVQG